MAFIDGTRFNTYIGLLCRDADGDFFKESTYLHAVNEMAFMLVNHRPEANQQRVTMSATAGPLQTIPTGMLELVDVEGIQDGTGVWVRRLRPRSIDLMDQDDAAWVAGCSANPGPKYYAYDQRKPRFFWLNPTASGGEVLSLVGSYPPALITETSDPIEVDERFFFVLVNGVLGRLYQSEHVDPTRAESYLAAFDKALSVGRAEDTVSSPNDRVTLAKVTAYKAPK